MSLGHRCCLQAPKVKDQEKRGIQVKSFVKRLAHSSLIQQPAFAPVRWVFDQVRLNLWNMSREDREGWRKRIDDVLTCPDIHRITTVPNAGKIVDGYLIMHNGLRIEPLSYYGYPMLRMFKLSKGIHEPQEELAFDEVLKVIPAGASMLELGSYWSFYSMCFCKAVQDYRSFMIEPTDFGVDFGKKNFALNGFIGDFTRAYVGKASGEAPDGVEIVNVDAYCLAKRIEFLDILHSDIQGFEGEMLDGASEMLSGKRIGYLFVSTHSNEIHEYCRSVLLKHGYEVPVSINLDDTYSVDGLIVAKSPDYPTASIPELSMRSRQGRA